MITHNNGKHFQLWKCFGEGRLQTIDPNQEQIEVPAQCVVETVDELIRFVYAEQLIPFDQDNIRRAILSPKNQQVDQINVYVMVKQERMRTLIP